jgi:hypothetical protein
LKIAIDELVKIIVAEVLTELSRQGIEVDYSSFKKIDFLENNTNDKEIIDLSSYKTPVLTEKHLMSLNKNKKEIIIPKRTVITPNARDIIKIRKLKVSHL